MKIETWKNIISVVTGWKRKPTSEIEQTIYTKGAEGAECPDCGTDTVWMTSGKNNRSFCCLCDKDVVDQTSELIKSVGRFRVIPPSGAGTEFVAGTGTGFVSVEVPESQLKVVTHYKGIMQRIAEANHLNEHDDQPPIE